MGNPYEDALSRFRNPLPGLRVGEADAGLHGLRRQGAVAISATDVHYNAFDATVVPTFGPRRPIAPAASSVGLRASAAHDVSLGSTGLIARSWNVDR